MEYNEQLYNDSENVDLALINNPAELIAMPLTHFKNYIQSICDTENKHHENTSEAENRQLSVLENMLNSQEISESSRLEIAKLAIEILNLKREREETEKTEQTKRISIVGGVAVAFGTILSGIIKRYLDNKKPWYKF